MAKEIAKVETQLPTTTPNPQPQQAVLSTDIIIPQLLLMQGLSEFIVEKKKCSVTNQKIETGHFVKSTTLEILGGEEAPIKFIPLKMVTNWKIEEKVGGKFQYRQTIARTPSNEHLDWSFQQNGTDWRRVKVLDIFAILPKDIIAYKEEMKKLLNGEMPDLNKTLMPVLIRFKSTGYKAGQAVATFYAQVQDLKRYKPDLQEHHFTLTLEAKPDKNDSGSYHIFKVGTPQPLDKDMLPEANHWASIMQTRNDLKVDETADTESGTVSGLSNQF